MSIQFRPLKGTVLVEVKPIESTRSAGGIWKPANSYNSFQEATIVAVPFPLDYSEEFGLKLNDKVLIYSTGGTNIVLNDKEYRLITPDLILGILSI